MRNRISQSRSRHWPHSNCHKSSSAGQYHSLRYTRHKSHWKFETHLAPNRSHWNCNLNWSSMLFEFSGSPIRKQIVTDSNNRAHVSITSAWYWSFSSDLRSRTMIWQETFLTIRNSDAKSTVNAIKSFKFRSFAAAAIASRVKTLDNSSWSISSTHGYLNRCVRHWIDRSSPKQIHLGLVFPLPLGSAFFVFVPTPGRFFSSLSAICITWRASVQAPLEISRSFGYIIGILNCNCNHHFGPSKQVLLISSDDLILKFHFRCMWLCPTCLTWSRHVQQYR